MHQNNKINRTNSVKGNYNKLFQINVEKCDGLEDSIINSINRLKYRYMVIKQLSYIFVLIFSLFGLIYSAQYVAKIFIESAIYEYISLIFVSTTVLQYWKEILYSVIESIPFLELAVLMSMISVLIWSISKIAKIQIIKSSYL